MGKQHDLKGMEQPGLPDLVDVGKRYKSAQRRRMQALAKEVELKDGVLAIMHEHKLTTYRDEDEDIEFELVPGKERLKVKTPSEEEEASDGEEE